ncbi:helix-turn-helix domain-containing protein [Paenibacillus radicis (ex Xue et al. 2023)]|uniref:Helix-turn-helix domain-containing protein n=1 Tax=Paenibacillus radicis (ex Xue et al. 2023) TaxID=2972489 RepID=A0ABT1YJ40_9BACL|nr:helix-turn-helix transcriptional regulator [Paenibacillus radicis (ex Xue et al. 2023)]MCR8633214.1 helix-turn-helix domain-containing protein [Paenibacillus radicis (ex Xue et al. 2023)]
MNIIGENVKRLRKIHNLNQVEFSNLIGVSQGSLSDIEAGNSKPSIDTVVSIYTNFGCSLEWLLSGKTNQLNVEKQKEMIFNNSELTLFENEFVSALRRLSMENQMEILEIINLKLRK